MPLKGNKNFAAKAACTGCCFNPADVTYVQKKMLTEKESASLTEIFKALSSETRIRILHALSCRELCVYDLSVALELSVSAVSHQLRLLKAARLVKPRRAGKNTYYSLDDEHIVSLFAGALEHVRHD
ncbi:MAG: winged helix-turn-helix transcriptional regulator [Firmicutes bacterium]|nr:winged helix-turn-helix transcriptional regulator [Bacillota bacterium]